MLAPGSHRVQLRCDVDDPADGDDDLPGADRGRAVLGDRHRRARTDRARTALRNGHRPKTVTTTAGDLELRIPKLRAGSFFPRPVGAAAGRPVAVRGDHGGLPARHQPPARSTTWSRLSAPTAGSARLTCRASAPSSTARWPRSATCRWPSSRSATRSWTLPSPSRTSSVTGGRKGVPPSDDDRIAEHPQFVDQAEPLNAVEHAARTTPDPVIGTSELL
jgi:hypothetical protein